MKTSRWFSLHKDKIQLIILRLSGIKNQQAARQRRRLPKERFKLII